MSSLWSSQNETLLAQRVAALEASTEKELFRLSKEISSIRDDVNQAIDSLGSLTVQVAKAMASSIQRAEQRCLTATQEMAQQLTASFQRAEDNESEGGRSGSATPLSRRPMSGLTSPCPELADHMGVGELGELDSSTNSVVSKMQEIRDSVRQALQDLKKAPVTSATNSRLRKSLASKDVQPASGLPLFPEGTFDRNVRDQNGPAFSRSSSRKKPSLETVSENPTSNSQTAPSPMLSIRTVSDRDPEATNSKQAPALPSQSPSATPSVPASQTRTTLHQPTAPNTDAQWSQAGSLTLPPASSPLSRPEGFGLPRPSLPDQPQTTPGGQSTQASVSIPSFAQSRSMSVPGGGYARAVSPNGAIATDIRGRPAQPVLQQPYPRGVMGAPTNFYSQPGQQGTGAHFWAPQASPGAGSPGVDPRNGARPAQYTR